MKCTGTEAKTSKPSAKVVELFSGAGLFGYAFRKQGFAMSCAYERDVVAASTYARNVDQKVKVCDLATQRPEGRSDILIAGPPCQGFSSLGKRDPNDPRNSLALIVPEWAVALKARVVVIENVALFLKSPILPHVVKRFEKAGFENFSWVINAADYGTPQRRVRSFTVFSKLGRPPLEKYLKLSKQTVREAFEDLPKFPSSQNQHFTLPRSKFALRRICLVPPGGDIRDIARSARHLVPPSWFRTSGKIVDIWGRMRWDDVSPTIRTGFLNPSRGRFLHPEEDRPISFREGARLQMVPDSFFFEGTPEQISRQIGNGVPLGLGNAMAKAIRDLMS